jgi:PiT family inorganic phosphate transporter
MVLGHCDRCRRCGNDVAEKDQTGRFGRVRIRRSYFQASADHDELLCELSHGANDVANAVGLVALVYWIISHGNVAQKVGVPVWLLALGGLGISAGALFLGQRVMKTVGEEITQLNNSRGFCIDFSTASTVLFASVLGLPISTTHLVVGSVVGVGTARGVELVNVGVLKNIVISWFATVPVSALVSAGFYLLILRFI